MGAGAEMGMGVVLVVGVLVSSVSSSRASLCCKEGDARVAVQRSVVTAKV